MALVNPNTSRPFTANGSDIDLNRSFGLETGIGKTTDPSLGSVIVFQEAIIILNKYVIPVIIVVGFFGNSVSLLVFLKTYFNRQSLSIYLAFLAAVDNLFLLALLCIWFSWVEIHILHKNGWCQTILYCTYVCSFLSVWTLVSLTVDRYITVFHPLVRRNHCTRQRAAIVIISLTIYALTFYAFSIKITGIRYIQGRPVCIRLPQFHQIAVIMINIDTVITLMIPTVSTITLNIVIGIKVCRYTNRLSRTNQTSDSITDMYSGASSRFSQPNNNVIECLELERSPLSSDIQQRPWRVYSKRRTSQIRITRAVLGVSTIFLALNLPSFAFRMHLFIISVSSQRHTNYLENYTWQELLQFLYFLGFSFKFFLYLTFSSKFRRALKSLFRRFKYWLREPSCYKESNQD